MSETDRPFFRTDLVSRPIDAAGHRFIEVTDPDSGSSFRFYEVEYAIACAMDGERDLFGLADWARIELGVEPSPDELQTVISTLEDLGYLEGAMMAAEPPPLDRPPPVGREAPASSFDAPSHFASDLSTDLSEHIPLRASDVKEAVRQSRAMPATRPPEDNFDDEAFDDEKTPAPYRPVVRAPAAAAAGLGPPPDGPAFGPPPVLQNALQKTLLGQPSPVPPIARQLAKSPTPPPMVLPDQPAEISRSVGPAMAPPAPAIGRPRPGSGPPPMRGPSSGEVPLAPLVEPTRSAAIFPYLVVLLLLSAAGAAVYWWFFLREEPVTGQGTESVNESAPVAPSTVEQPPPVEAQPAPAPPPPPPEIIATLEAGPTQAQELTAPRPGRILWLAPDGGEVAEGAPVGKYDGYQAPEYAVREAQESQRRYRDKLEQATAKDDKDAMKEAEGNVKRKQGDIERRTEELDKFLIKAPAGGLVELVIKPRTNVKKDQVVAKILAQSEPRATFALPADYAHQSGEARVVSRSDPSLGGICKVEPSEPGKLAVSCPTDSGLASGMEIVLKP